LSFLNPVTVATVPGFHFDSIIIPEEFYALATSGSRLAPGHKRHSGASPVLWHLGRSSRSPALLYPPEVFQRMLRFPNCQAHFNIILKILS
jgi:hypothetical protein